MPQRVARRVGRRGSVLLLLALVGAAHAYGLATDGRTAHGFLPVAAWVMLWLVAAGVCAGAAFVRRDQWAFALISGVALLWACAALGGWLLGDAPRGLITAIIWFGVAAVCYVVSGWPE